MKTTGTIRFLAWALVFWAGFMIAAVADGILRQTVLIPNIGEAGAYIASGLLMLGVIYAGTWGLLASIGRPRARWELWTAGFLWGALTVGFELFIVVVARGEAAAVLWADYHPANILSGNLILPGLVLMIAAPAIVVLWMRR